MRTEMFSQIRPLPLFRDLLDAHFERLTRAAYVQNFPEQIELIHEGEPSDFLHIVIDGSVELFSAWNRRDTVMATVRPVSTFILAATIKHAPFLMSARTLEKSRIILLPSGDVREVFDTSTVFARAIVAELASGYRTVVKHAKNLKLRSSVERLANHLLRQFEAGGEVSSFVLDTEKRRLASYLGMTPENLSRAFKTLGPYGVTINGARISIGDPATLRQLAKPTPLIDDPAH